MGDAVDDAYEKSKANAERMASDPNVVDVIPIALTSRLKELKGDIDVQYAKLIKNPYLAPHIVDDFKSTLMQTVAILIEHDIPLQDPTKKRTVEDIVTEGLAELGGMLGAKGAVAAMKAKRTFRERWNEFRQQDDFEIFQDPQTDDYYFIDPETGEEVDCDEYGEPIWEDN